MLDRVAEMTERLLHDAGIRSGMRVLDVGCATGALTMTVARLVEDGGHVVGIDRNERALVRARAAAKEAGHGNVRFMQADLMSPPIDDGLFDVIVGRRVLMFQPDSTAAVAAMKVALRPGGTAVFQEIDTRMVPASTTSLPLHDRAQRWIWKAAERAGANLSMGLELAPSLRDAGLEVQGVRAEAVVQLAGRRHVTADIVRAMQPLIVQHGIASAEEIAIDTLDARLANELRETGAAYVGDMVFGAWAQKPS